MTKLKITTVIALIISIINVYAQQPHQTEKRTYISPNGDLFVQKELPIYLRLATSPEDNAKTILLKSKISAKYSNPLYFDTDGKNTIATPWAIDPVTKKYAVPKQEVIFEVYADGISPVTGSKFHSAPKYLKGGVTFFGKNLKVDVTSRDAVSGVEKIYSSIDGAAYIEYKSTLQMDKEGARILKYYSADNVGNSENPITKTFTVDLSSPKTTFALHGDIVDNIISARTNVTLASTDNLSGVNTTYYFFDNKSAKVYSGPIYLASLGDGEHTLSYYSKDNVLNIEEKQQAGDGKGPFKFYLDKTPPVASHDIVGDKYFGKHKYVSARTKIQLTATDNKAGVLKIGYIMDNKGDNTYSSTFLIPNKLGTHTLKYYGIDKVKNKSTDKTLTVFVDNVTPTTGINYGKPQFFNRDTLFINKNTKISLPANDQQSGVLKTEYSIDGGSKITYSAPFTNANIGFHTITFQSTDKVNNIEKLKTSHFFIDNTPPKIYQNYSIQSIGSKTKGGKKIPIYPNYTRLYLGATDDHCGTARILYSINGEPFRDYSSPYTLDISELNLFAKKNIFYIVKVKVTDKLGNESQDQFEFYVGK